MVEPIKIPIQMDDRMLSGVTRKDAAQMKADPQNVKRPGANRGAPVHTGKFFIRPAPASAFPNGSTVRRSNS
jgi:hypothetical protein